MAGGGLVVLAVATTLLVAVGNCLTLPLPDTTTAQLDQLGTSAGLDSGLIHDFGTCVFSGLARSKTPSLAADRANAAAACAFTVSAAAASGQQLGEDVAGCCDVLDSVLADLFTRDCVCGELLKVVTERKIDLGSVCKNLKNMCEPAAADGPCERLFERLAAGELDKISREDDVKACTKEIRTCPASCRVQQ